MSGFNIFEALENKKGQEKDSDDEISKNDFKIKLISIYDLESSKYNFYPVKDKKTQELKNSVEMFGIKQNLVVKKDENNKYEVLAGHRRLLVSHLLVDEGKKEFVLVPCTIEKEKSEITKIDRLLDRLLLITTNSTTREYSEYAKMKELEDTKEVLEALRAEGYGKTGRIRDLIANMIKISSSKVARLESISKNLTPEFKEEFKENEINISTAYELSRLEEAEQQSLFEEYQDKGSLSIKDVTEKSEEKKSEINELETYEIEEDENEVEEIENIISFPTATIEDEKEEGKVFKTIFEILKDMKIRKFAEFICSQCNVTGTFCDYAMECNDKNGKGCVDICIKWLKMEAQEME
ncbi:Nucleoid occlusion protein [Clostridioides difficile]|nr:Nucleoid occlusion protein [Clostridioides difficile]CZR99881.1 Nucleoid occlusion protein [Clostridioides difficile]